MFEFHTIISFILNCKTITKNDNLKLTSILVSQCGHRLLNFPFSLFTHFFILSFAWKFIWPPKLSILMLSFFILIIFLRFSSFTVRFRLWFSSSILSSILWWSLSLPNTVSKSSCFTYSASKYNRINRSLSGILQKTFRKVYYY